MDVERLTRVAILGSVLVGFMTGSAEAATRTWSGATSGVWSVASNWEGGVAPIAGDTLVFPAGATTKVMANNLGVGFDVAGLVFTGGYTLSGDSLTLGGGGIACAGAGITAISQAIALTANTAIDVSASCELRLAGALSGAVDLTKTSNSVLRLTGANTYTKQTIINGGFLVAGSASALGTGDGTSTTGTVVNTSGSLNISANIANEAITIHGQGQNNNGVLQVGADGTFSLGGPVTLGDNNVTMTVINNRELVFNGVVGGTGRFGIAGSGTFTLANSGNSFSGTTSLGGSATLKLGASDVIPDSTSLVFTTGSGAFNLNNFDETIADISGSVNVLTGPASVLTIDLATDRAFSGRFYGEGVIVKAGSARLTLPFSQFITGTMSVFGGSLIVDTDLPSAATVAPGGTLGGSGSIAKIVLATGGTIAPGSSPGILGTAALQLSSSATLAVELNGAVAGVGYDQLNTSGSVTLGNSTLALSVGYTPVLGTQFTILNNGSVSPVSGTFAGLPEGGVVSADGQSFAISYVGGTGNDVVLTAVVPVPTLGLPGMLSLLLLLATAAVWRLRRSRQPQQV